MYLFNFYRNLAEGDQPLTEQIQAARASFPDKGMATHSLVISHKRRVAMNAAVQRQKFREAAPEHYLRLPRLSRCRWLARLRRCSSGLG